MSKTSTGRKRKKSLFESYPGNYKSKHPVIVSISDSVINSDYESLSDQQDALAAITQYYLVSKRDNIVKYNVGKDALHKRTVFAAFLPLITRYKIYKNI